MNSCINVCALWDEKCYDCDETKKMMSSNDIYWAIKIIWLWIPNWQHTQYATTQKLRNDIVMIQYCELLTHTNRCNCDVVNIEFVYVFCYFSAHPTIQMRAKYWFTFFFFKKKKNRENTDHLNWLSAGPFFVTFFMTVVIVFSNSITLVSTKQSSWNWSGRLVDEPYWFWDHQIIYIYNIYSKNIYCLLRNPFFMLYFCLTVWKTWLSFWAIHMYV